jgi:uncharacterized protein (UPF0548 family)
MRAFMPRRPTLPRRLATATRWPLGVSLTSWRYLWRTTPMARSEVEGTWPEDAPPPLPSGIDRAELQLLEDGAGAFFRRRYSVEIAGAKLSAEELMAELRGDPDRAAPSEFGTFQKLHGPKGRMQVADEYVVRMPGPWDGPVRVLATSQTSFRLATLAGHLEAGQIEFRAHAGDLLRVEIESWARSGDRLSDLLYDRLRMSKEIQMHMWTSFLERVVKLAGGRRIGRLGIHTRRLEWPPGRRTLGDPRARHALDTLHDKQLNFDIGARNERSQGSGWRVDDYCQPLPAEAPGPPDQDGSFERAKQLMCDYEFADPAIVRAIYHPDSPLEGRDMLLEARFWGLRFRFGVRVGGVIDETRTIDGREARVWGWNYATLQDHLEMGQMDYEVWKWTDDGSVEFRIHVVSRAARIPNPIIRLGFRVFGRSQQIRFAKRACERMACLLAGEPEVERSEEITVVTA